MSHRQWRGSIRHVTIDDLGERDVAVVAHEVEARCLDRRRIHGFPRKVLALQLGEGRLLGLEGDRLDGGRAIDGLLGAGDIRQPVIARVS